MKYLKFPLLALVALMMAAPAYGGKQITLKGSDTMVVLVQRWAEAYMAKNPGVVLQVTGGGSGTGLSALQNGSTDIAMSSRPIAQKEKDSMRARFNALPTETAVAKDGLTVFVHSSNPVNELSLEQLAGIYTGTITSWSQVGGKAEKIVLYSRENSSGTYAYFKEKVLEDEDFAANTQTLPGTAAVVNAVSKEAKAIGYGGHGYGKGVKMVKIKKTAQSAGVEATADTVRNGSYPISRDLYFYTATAPSGDVKKFIDWVKSPEGQAVVTQAGYFPLK